MGLGDDPPAGEENQPCRLLTGDEHQPSKLQVPEEQKPTRLRIIAWSLVGAAIFEVSWWNTGGGYNCSVPIFLALFCFCYGRLLLSPAIVKVLARNIRTNVKSACKEEKSRVLLIVSYFAIKFGLSVTYPQGEKSNGSPISLIAFTVLFITIFLVPFLYRTSCNLLLGCTAPPFSVIAFKTGVVQSTEAGQSRSWRQTLWCYLKALTKWKRSVVVCLILVFISYEFDSSITALVRFVGEGKPCWPVFPPKMEELKSIPDNIQNAYPWHRVYPMYHPTPAIKAFILIGRELGEVCHLLPMLIGTYTLSQVFLPPENSLIKKTLFASIAGVVLGGVISGSFKVLFHRYRPNAYGDPYMWKGPGMATVNHLMFSKLDLSFPAGHTTVTTAVATCWYASILANFKQLCISPCISTLILFCFYANPLLVLVSRVSECCHWTSDATFGIFLGYLVGITITSRMKPERSERNPQILPL